MASDNCRDGRIFVQSLKRWDVYIKSKNVDRPIVVPATGTDPDDALTDCESRHQYFPSIGDRVVRIVEVNRRRGSLAAA